MRLPALLLVMFALVACSGGDSVSDRAQGTGFIAGDGSIQQFSAEDRDTEITLRGTALDGKAIDSSTWRGSIVVINTWGSWCAPCNAEAPDLADISARYAQSQVQFLGVNLREDPPAAQAFERKFGIDYPSLAWDGGKTLVQLKGKAPSTP
ncbi:MAG: TlpA disulfide reductase family protein, partial [Angustibacter sp.]